MPSWRSGRFTVTGDCLPECRPSGQPEGQRGVTRTNGKEITMDARLDLYGNTVAAKFVKYINSAGATPSPPPAGPDWACTEMADLWPV
jgi:hypothetical protein